MFITGYNIRRNLYMELNNHCHPETLTRISKFTLFIKKFNPLTEREGKNNVILSESEESHKIEKSYEIFRLKPQYDENNMKTLIDLSTYQPIDHNGLLTSHHSLFTRKCAFTLAEVLITLGIIGVVAAITIPTLSQKLYEKRTVTQLRAVQSILAQAIKAAEAEDGEVEGWGLKQDRSKEDAELIAEKLRKHMKVAHDCGTEPDTNGFCFPNTTYTYLNGNKSPNYANRDYYYKIVLNNGASIFIQSYPDNTDNDEGYLNFNVDINGPKPPNTVGKDLFDFNYSKGSVRPNGAPGSEGYGNCDKKKSGWGCAYYVLQTGKLLK